MSQKDFCFCTLALGSKYRFFVKQLAQDLEVYSPGTMLVVYTDVPEDLKSQGNILAVKHQQEGILLCYHDKRLPIARALSEFRVAIFLDADMRIIAPVPDNINWIPGITAGHQENLLEHIEKYTPEKLVCTRKLAPKLKLDLASTKYIGECIFIVTRDGGTEKEFIQEWGKIGRYFELNKHHSGEGTVMGLAAAKVGWDVHREGWEAIRNVTHHLGGASVQNISTSWDNFKMRMGYHWRLNKGRLLALQDFDFYYR
ncbi:MAG: hypothetical protein VKL59_24130 [Nostocaceae cyanobacterium]|nr:hypothetical protein [Nostocaceae cyanobacterium]